MNRLAEHVRPIGAQEHRDLRAVQHGIEARRGMRFGADGIDAGIGTASVGQFLDALVNILLHEIDGDRACVRGHSQPLRHRVDGDHPFGTQQEGTPNGKLRHRAAAEDGDGLAAFDVAEFGAHVAGRKDVRQEQDLRVSQPVRNLDWAGIGKRNPEIFGLTSWVAT